MPPLAAAIPAAIAAITPATAISGLATAGGLAATIMGANVQKQGIAEQAENAEALGTYQQEQYLQEADTSVAQSQRAMEEQQRKGKLVESTLVARGAGSGLDTTMGSVSELGQNIAGRSEYASLMDLSRGQDMAAGFTNMGAGAKYQGDLAESMVPQQTAAANINAASSVFSTLGRFKYG
jgi:hypothetical protein